MIEIILDVDGVLVNTDESYSRAAILTAEKFGGRLRSLEDVFSLRSQGSFNDDYDLTMEFLRQDQIEAGRQDVIDVFQSFYLGDQWQQGQWSGFITQEPLLANDEFCQWIKERGQFSVFTGRPKEEAFYVMKRLNLFGAMNHLVAMHDVVKKKPDPEGLEQIITLNNYHNPMSCGDTLDDWFAARSLGIDFVGILPPHSEAKKMMQEAFEREQCPHVLESINQLPHFVSQKEAS